MVDAAALRKLADSVAQMDASGHEELARLVAAHDVPYTRNSNGMFVDMCGLPARLVKAMQDFVSFSAFSRQPSPPRPATPAPSMTQPPPVQVVATVARADSSPVIEAARVLLGRQAGGDDRGAPAADRRPRRYAPVRRMVAPRRPTGEAAWGMRMLERDEGGPSRP
jgi:hypothetical protein